MLRRSIRIGIASLLVFLGSLYVFNHSASLAHWPWVRHLGLVYPQAAVLDAQDNLYVIDNSERRLLRINREDKVSLVVEGGVHESGRFFYAKAVAVSEDGSSIFVLNNRFDGNGFYLLREEILRFDAGGAFREVLYSRDVKEDERKPSLVQRGRVQGMSFADGRLRWFEVDHRGIQPFQWAPGTTAGPVGPFFPLEGADLRVGVLASQGEGVLASLKNGEVWSIDQSGHRTVYAAPKSTFGVVPWAVEADAQGRAIFIDLASRSVKRVDGQGALETVFGHPMLLQKVPDVANFNYYRLSLGPSDQLVLTNDEAVLVWAQDQSRFRYLSEVALTDSLWAERVFFWSILAVTVLLGSVLLLWLTKKILLDLGEIVYQSVMIVVAVAIAAVFSSNLLLDSLSQQYERVVVDKISNMLQSTPKSVDPSLFSSINGIGDFDSEAYAKIRESFLDSLNHNRDSWNQSNYFAIYRVIDGQLAAFMYLNGSVGMMHPFDWLGDESVYDQALAGRIATERNVDVTGEWLYGVAPIQDDKGNVVALYETGTDLYAFRLANKELIKGIVIQLATILVVMIFVLIEATYFYRLLRERMDVAKRQNSLSDSSLWGEYSDIKFARPLIFVFFAAITVSLTFIPVLMNDLYEPVAGLSRDVAIALPISLETFFFGLSSVVAVKWIRFLGWRRLFLVGIFISALSLLASGMAQDMLQFCLARSFAGLGSGIGYIAVRALINMEKRQGLRSEGYSHFYAGMIGGTNVGVVVGSAIADAHGFDQAFYVAAMLTALLFFGVLFGFRRQPYISSERNSVPVQAGWGAIFSMLRDVRVWVFLSCVIVPSYAAGTFLAYYLPLFAEEQGLSTADVGRLFIFNGLFIIYLGPLLNRLLKEHLGDFRTIVVGGWLWGLSLIIFGLESSLFTMFLVLIIMGVTEGFNAPAQNDYFLSMHSSRRLGEDTATAYFELFGKVGETLGPLAFAVALMMGQGSGMMVLGVLVILSTVPVIVSLRSAASGDVVAAANR
jgi:predicted MFS family arabinose efflux permease